MLSRRGFLPFLVGALTLPTELLALSGQNHHGTTSKAARPVDPQVSGHSHDGKKPCSAEKTTVSRRRALIGSVGASMPFIITGTTTTTLLQQRQPSASVALALTPEQAASQYDSYAPTYDRLDGGKASTLLGIDQAREELFPRARGNVLEIGVGTGLNLDKYNGAQLTSLTLVDISDGMLQQAKERVQSLPNLRGVPVTVVNADATTELVDRFGSQSFDTVVDSFSLCVMGNQGAQQCLDQLRQVVKPQAEGGKVLLLENTRSSNPLLGMYQDATADTAALAGGKGCVYNQDVGAMIRGTKGLVLQEERLYAAGLFRSYVCARSPPL